MKKLALALLILFLFCAVLAPIALAYESPDKQITEQALEAVKTIESPNLSFGETVQNLLSGNVKLSFEGMVQSLLNLLLKEVKENLSTLVKLLVLAILSGILCNLQQSMPESGIGEVAFLACFAGIAGLSVSIIASLSELAAETIDSLMLFIASLMPVLCGLVSSAGQAAMSGFYPVLFLAMQSFVSICQQFFLPLISVVTALSVTNAMSNRFQIAGLITTARNIIKWGLGLLLTIFVGILGIHSFSAFATGSIAGRTVKYALCNFIPLVGSVLAESIEAVIASLKLIKGSIGVTGVLALMTLCILPLLKILTVSLLYRFAAGVAEPATDKRVVRLLSELAGNITLIFSILLMVSVMFIISIALLCGFFF